MPANQSISRLVIRLGKSRIEDSWYYKTIEFLKYSRYIFSSLPFTIIFTAFLHSRSKNFSRQQICLCCFSHELLHHLPSTDQSCYFPGLRTLVFDGRYKDSAADGDGGDCCCAAVDDDGCGEDGDCGDVAKLV